MPGPMPERGRWLRFGKEPVGDNDGRNVFAACGWTEPPALNEV
jgi:hypothetical protein